ncbi:C-X-C motif chemokine 16-like [Engystomops pustulosus]|uniref:C-X-C motif chemokine 16-like n=1 Tax=Engystomops pustulosus TaxID=76066 RepID=UPI003AFB406A
MKVLGSSALLALVFILTPQPGVSQHAHLFRLCQDCAKKMLEEGSVKENLLQNMYKNANYMDCPHNIVRVQLRNHTYCATRGTPWVDKVTGCIDKGRTSCLSSTENRKDFSKGSENEKPPSTTQRSTSAGTTLPLIQSTQTWKGGTSKPSEIITVELKNLGSTIGLPTTAPDSEQNNDLLHGNGPSVEKDDEKGKMKQMQIAIISLILIVLVMSAIGMYIWCRRRKTTTCRSQCAEESVHYQPAPSEES